MTNREIAERLGLSEHGTKNQLSTVYGKLGLSNRVELALCYVKNIEGFGATYLYNTNYGPLTPK